MFIAPSYLQNLYKRALQHYRSLERHFEYPQTSSQHLLFRYHFKIHLVGCNGKNQKPDFIVS